MANGHHRTTKEKGIPDPVVDTRRRHRGHCRWRRAGRRSADDDLRAFPLSDEEYLAASQQALADPNTQGVQDAFATLGLFGDSSRIVVSPRRVDEVRGALYITYEAKTPEGDLFRRMGRTLDIMVGFEPATGWRASVQPRSQ
ncbi:MAG: hypothetical protein UY53_C0004G0040 [Parcubacteria group bacterium GW2011_GWA2_50_10]|nr:MAG: hypothetical protein UY53_C0004G0040 [Parcubacteria group bacterium GW2011_GWA2_50_10]